MNQRTPDETNDPLQSIIAEILDAEGNGEAIDRSEILEKYPDHAESLANFFAAHDRMKHAADEDTTATDEATLPPSSSILDPAVSESETTLPPDGPFDDEQTLAPGTAGAGDNPAAFDLPSASVGDRVRYFGDYELVEEIARGGMGVVFKSRQLNLNRIVALKMILAGQLASEEDVQRFQTEAEAAANLDHPGIVPIFEIGEHSGQHYFSMGYVEGESLAARVAEGPLTAQAAAEMTRKVSEAMDYAHNRGVIHRDLKPANILLDSNDQPKVTDFGLAKKTEADSNLTGTGQILGTPSYMAPEQAGGKVEEIGPLADVYAIGAILYCLLSGKPPFQAASPMDTLLQVLDQEPLPLRTLNSAVPVDLETICLKCLNKDPKKRYQSAAELAEELERFLNGEPIHARPVSRLERVWRWSKRRPALASMSAAVVLLATALAVGGPLAAMTQSRLRQTAVENEARAKKNEERAKKNEERATKLAEAESRALSEVEQSQRALALEKDKSDRALYARTVALAYRELNNGNLTSAEDMLASLPVELRGFEWDYVNSLCHTELGQYIGLESVPRFVALADGATQVIAAHSSGSKYGQGKTYFWKRDGEQPSEIRELLAIAASTDGQRLAVIPPGSSGELQITETASGKIICKIAGHKPQITLAVFGGPNESQVATTGSDKTVRIWDAQTGKQLQEIKQPYRGRIPPIALSADGKWIAWRNADHGKIEIFDTSGGRNRFTGEYTRRMAGPRAPVAFSPDSRSLAVGGYREVEIVSVPDGKRIGVLDGLRGYASDLVYSPDGNRIAVTCQDGTIRIYDADKMRPLNSLTGHDIGAQYGISVVAFDDTGDFLVSGGNNKDIKLWDAWSGDRDSIGRSTRPDSDLPRPSQTADYLPAFNGHVENVRLKEDGKLLIGASTDGSVRIIDTQTGEVIREWTDLENMASVDYDATTKRVIAGGGGINDRQPGEIVAWNFDTGEEQWRSNEASGPIKRLEFFKDGSRVAVAVGSQTVLKGELFVLEAASGEVLWRKEMPLSASSVRDLAIAPDGSWIATVGSSNGVQIWDAESGELKRTVGDRLCFSIAINDDGTKLACGTARWNVILMDAVTGEQEWAQHRHYGAVSALAFVEDGKRIISTSFDGTTRIWDTRYGDLVLTLEDTGVPKYSLSITDDARLWTVSGEDVSVVVRRRTTDRPATQVADADNAEAAEENWITLFEDDFEREKLGEHWKPAIGTWSIDDGAAMGVAAPVGYVPGWHGCLMASMKKVSGDVEVSLDAWIDSPMLLETSFSDMARLNSVSGMYIGVQGTDFNFGEKGVAINYALRGKFATGPSRREGGFEFVPNRKYRFRTRKTRNRVELFIDDEFYRGADIAIGYPTPMFWLQGLLGKNGSKVWIDNLVVKGPPGANLDITAAELVTKIGGEQNMKPLVIEELKSYDYTTLEGDPAELRRRALRIADRWPEDIASVLRRTERLAIENKKSKETFSVIQNWIEDEVKVKTEQVHRGIASAALRADDTVVFWDSLNQAIQSAKRERGVQHPAYLAMSGLKLHGSGNAKAVKDRANQLREVMRASHLASDSLAKDWSKLFFETVALDEPDPTEEALKELTWQLIDAHMMKGDSTMLPDHLAADATTAYERTKNDPKPLVTDRQNWIDCDRLWSMGFPLADSRMTRTNVHVDLTKKQPMVMSWFLYQVRDNYFEWLQIDHFVRDDDVDPKQWKLAKQIRRTTNRRRGGELYEIAKDGWDEIDAEIEKADESGDLKRRLAIRALSGRDRESLELAIELVRSDKTAENYAILAEAARHAGDAKLMFKSAAKAIELDPYVVGPPAVRALAAKLLAPDERQELLFGVSAIVPEIYKPGQLVELGAGDLAVCCWHPTPSSIAGAWHSPTDKEDALETGVEAFVKMRDQMFGAKLVRRQERTIGGQPAIELVFRGTGINGAAMPNGQGGPMYQRFLFIKRKQDLVTFFIGAGQNEFVQRDSEFGQVMRSVKFDPSTL